MSLPSWLQSALKVPVMKYGVGVVAILVVFLFVALRAAWVSRKRLRISKQIRVVEKSFAEEIQKLDKKEKAQILKVEIKKKDKLASLEKKNIEIKESARAGLDVLSDLANRTFGTTK